MTCHQNIAAIYDFADFGDSRFLVLELVEGEMLADRMPTITSGTLGGAILSAGEKVIAVRYPVDCIRYITRRRNGERTTAEFSD